MKYMSVWSISPENLPAVLERWTKHNPMPGKGVEMLGRYHEMGTGKGYALFEAKSPGALAKYLLGWADLCDQKVVPVLDDKEMKRALK